MKAVLVKLLAILWGDPHITFEVGCLLIESRFFSKAGKISFQFLLFIQFAFYPDDDLIKGFLDVCLRIPEVFQYTAFPFCSYESCGLSSHINR